MPAHFDSPIAPNFSRRLSEKTLDTIKEFPKTESPTQPQTFLYSPSEASFRMDSPLLPHIERHASEDTACNSITEGAYPSPLHQRTFLHSPSEASFHSHSWSSSTAVERPSPRLTTHRISDLLPHETDFYYSEGEDDDYLAEWNVSPPSEHVGTETEPLLDQARLDLPVIKDKDFPYYTEPVPVQSARSIAEERQDDLRVLRRKLDKMSAPRMFSIRDVWRQMLMKVKRKTHV
ncbi:uncharacterized protein K460DRAFT_45491 [Cucurbitaria berberidis CBS 394.84]|uniref:Uncharacterized protein n=1 Tax=Cucurbitaria berberidis CBS 394.84 TaxID=1168544 RepID=A0A9P4GUI1_9PLEO|nr:uncharacterized protein K460DRAFT_45491 [Cucurbitaria berberidis CBS 394.84]KAF1852015.1 hypothetical protein K460DRAFT_45491 [Cucurbitaria berberidis CBS 394.84]